VVEGPFGMELPRLASLDWVAAMLSVVALVAVFWLKLSLPRLLLGMAGLGLMAASWIGI